MIPVSLLSDVTAAAPLRERGAAYTQFLEIGGVGQFAIQLVKIRSAHVTSTD